MDTGSEREIARASREDREADTTRAAEGSGHPPSWLGRVTTATASVGVGKFLKVRPLSLLGSESEGSSGTAADLGTDDKAVYLVGPGKPALNDQVVARWVNWRWVTGRRAAGGCTISRSALGCNNTAIMDAVLTVTQGGVTIGTDTTAGDGVASVTLPASGTYSFTFTATNYSSSGSVSVTCPGTNSASVSLAPASGRICCGANNPENVALPVNTLNVSIVCPDTPGFSAFSTLNRVAGTCNWIGRLNNAFPTGVQIVLTYLGLDAFSLTQNPGGPGFTDTSTGNIASINLTFDWANYCGFGSNAVVTVTP